jgi:hypothetical protein
MTSAVPPHDFSTGKIHDAKVEPALRAAAPCLLSPVVVPPGVLLEAGLVLTGWCRRAGRGGTGVPLAPWRARSPVAAGMTGGTRKRGWLRQAAGAGAVPGSPCGRGLAGPGRRWCRPDRGQAGRVTACVPARAGCQPQE